MPARRCCRIPGICWFERCGRRAHRCVACPVLLLSLLLLRPLASHPYRRRCVDSYHHAPGRGGSGLLSSTLCHGPLLFCSPLTGWPGSSRTWRRFSVENDGRPCWRNSASGSSERFREPCQSLREERRPRNRAVSTFWLWRHGTNAAAETTIRRLCGPSIKGRLPRGWGGARRCVRLRSGLESGDEMSSIWSPLTGRTPAANEETKAVREQLSQDSLC